jgi:hypothetical protein
MATKFDTSKLLKPLTAGHGSILAPHINAYQSRGKFPDKWIIEIDNTRVEDEYFHPSTDALASPLSLYRRKSGASLPEKITSNQRRTYDCGHMWHRYLQNILIDMGFVKPENVERQYLHQIVTKRGGTTGKGTLDLVDVEIPGHGTWPVVDIKTANKSMYERGFDKNTLAKYTAQVNLYMDWVGAERAMILVINKDSPHDMREYVIQRSQSLIDEIYDRWTYVAQCLRAGVEPE